MPNTAGLQREVIEELMPRVLCGAQHIRLLRDISLQAVTPICFLVALCVACVEKCRNSIKCRPVSFFLWEIMRKQVAKQAVVTVAVPLAP